MSELEIATAAKEKRLKEQIWHFLKAMRTLQTEGHNVDDVLQILCDNLDDLGVDGDLLEELRKMQGGHK
jgi:archaellum biogenesis protein FlaJ (TadC family)